MRVIVSYIHITRREGGREGGGIAIHINALYNTYMIPNLIFFSSDLFLLLYIYNFQNPPFSPPPPFPFLPPAFLWLFFCEARFLKEKGGKNPRLWWSFFYCAISPSPPLTLFPFPLPPNSPGTSFSPISLLWQRLAKNPRLCNCTIK